MASDEVREDIVQLTVAAYGAAPDAALMRELEAIVDRGGSLLDVASALTTAERWGELYPSSQAPADFSDAWLGALLPGVDEDLLAVGRGIVVPHLEADNPVAGLVLAAQAFLSGPDVSEPFDGFASAFLGRGETALAELVAEENAEDIVQLAVAAYDAAPGAALVEEMEAVIDGGGSLLDVAEALVAGERWDALYPDSLSPEEFSDAWLGNLLPGVDEGLLAVGRAVVVPHIEAGNSPAGLVLAAQDFLSDPAVPSDFADFAGAFLNKGEVAAAHSVTEELDGSPDELREVLASVTDDDATVQAAIDALGGEMPGGEMPGGEMPGGEMPGGEMPGGGNGGGGQTPTPGGGGNGNGGQTQTPGGGGNGNGGQTPPAGEPERDSTDDLGRVTLREFDDNEDGTYDRAAAYSYLSSADDARKDRTDFYDMWDEGEDASNQQADRSVFEMRDYDGDGSADDSKTVAYDDAGRAVRTAYDHDSDGTDDRVEEYTFGADADDERWLTFSEDPDGDGTVDRRTTVTHHGTADRVETRKIEHDDGSGGKTADDGTVDRAVLTTFGADRRPVETKIDDNGDGQWDRTVESVRETMNNQGLLALTETDLDGDGDYDRGEVYTWNAEGTAKVLTEYYDDWDEKTGTDDLDMQRLGRSRAVEHDAATGAVISDLWKHYGDDDALETRFYTEFDSQGRRTKFLLDGTDGTPADDTWDSAQEYEYDGASERVVKVSFADSVEGGPDGADASYDIDRTESYDGSEHVTDVKFFGIDDDAGWDRSVAFMRSGGRVTGQMWKFDRDDDGSTDGTRRVVMDGEGRPAKAYFDNDNDGSVDLVEAFSYLGRDTSPFGVNEYKEEEILRSILLSPAGTGAAVVESHVGAAAGVEILQAIGVSGDVYGRVTERSYYGTYDVIDGAANQTPDWVHRYTYDAADPNNPIWLTFEKNDNAGDGNVHFEHKVTNSFDEDGRIFKRVTELDDGAGADPAAVADDGVVDRRTEETLDGLGKAASVRTELLDGEGRAGKVEYDHDADGTVDRITESTFDPSGNLRREQRKTDEDADGVFDRAEVFDLENNGRVIQRSLEPDAAGMFTLQVAYQYDTDGREFLITFDEGHDDSYERAEEYRYNAEGQLERTLHYDDYDEAAPLADQTVSRSDWLRQDYDGDGASDDGKSETYDAEGRPVLAEYDYGGDGRVNRIETHARAGDVAVVLNRFDDGTGTGSGGDVAGDGAIDRRTLATTAGDAALRVLVDADNDGSWDGTEDDNQIVDEERFQYSKADGEGWLWIREANTDGAAGYDEAEVYTWRDDAVVRVDFYPAWDDESDPQNNRSFWSSSTHYGAERDGDYRYDDIKHERLSGRSDAKVEWVLYDHDSDGTLDEVQKVESYVTIDSQARPEVVKAGTPSTNDRATATVETVTSLERYAYDTSGELKQAEFDADNNGTYDRAERYYYAASGKLARIDYFDAWDESNTPDAAAPSDRRFVLVDLDADGAVDDAEHRTLDADGRSVLIEHQYDLSGVVGRRDTYTYDGAAEDWKTFSKNSNPQEDSVYEYRETAERDAGGAVNKLTIEFDDGSGAGAADDGTFDRRAESAINTASARFAEVTGAKYDNDNDGTWDVVDAYTWGTEDQGPESGTRTLTMNNDDAADDVTVDIAYVYGTAGADVEAGAAGVQWIDLGRGDDDMTGGAGDDVFVFRPGDGADIIRDLTAGDRILVDAATSYRFDSGDVAATHVALNAGEEGMHPRIPASLFPAAGEPTVEVAVVTYGGEPYDRIIIVGADPNADYSAFFMAHPGDVGGG